MSETMNENREYLESNGVTFYYVRNTGQKSVMTLMLNQV